SSRLQVGDVVVAVDGKPLAAGGNGEAATPAVDLGAALISHAGKETLLEVRRPPAAAGAGRPTAEPSAGGTPATSASAGSRAGAGGNPSRPRRAPRPAEPVPQPGTIFVLITPVSATENDNLRYEAEVEDRRATVERLSGGKLGYLHIRGMSEPSVRDFE